jgi:SRSO17 transposase
LADLETEASNYTNQSLWTRGLLVRRHIADGDLAFFTTWCPAGTSLETMAAVEGHRWAIEDSVETAKNEFGRSGSITMRADPGTGGIVMYHR